MNKKKISWLILLTVILNIVFTHLYVSPVTASTGMDKIASEMTRVYPFFEQADKDAVDAARANLQTLQITDPLWDDIINPLLTDQVEQKFSAVGKDARTELINFVKGMGNVYYSTDSLTLNSNLTDFKNAYLESYQILFGDGSTLDEIYQFYATTRQQFSVAIKSDLSYINNLAFGTDQQLIDTMPNVIISAMREALKTQTVFDNKLSLIGWSAEALVDQERLLAAVVDIGSSAELGMAKAIVRSEALLSSGETTVAVGDGPQFGITIMGKNATNLVHWHSDNSAVADFEYVDDSVLTTEAVGTTQIIAYRAYDGATPANDWIYRFDVTVTDNTQTVSVTDVTLDKSSINLAKGKSETLIATVAPADATNKDVTWSTSNSSVATVDNTGKVTVVSNGTAIITVTTIDGGFNQTCTVNAFVYGDVDGSGAFDVTDYGYMKLYLLGKMTTFPDINGLIAADVDASVGDPDVTDYGYMKLMLLSKMLKFPADL